MEDWEVDLYYNYRIAILTTEYVPAPLKPPTAFGCETNGKIGQTVCFVRVKAAAGPSCIDTDVHLLV